MNLFEEKRKKYIEKLEDNYILISNLKNNSTNLENLEIVLNPKNEDELEIAEAIFTFFYDVYTFINSNLEFDLSDNKSIAMYIELVNKLKNEEEINEKDYLYDSKTRAQIIFDSIKLFNSNSIDVLTYVSEKCGYDIDNNSSYQEFNMYFSKANKIINDINGNLFDSVNIKCDSKSVKEALEFINEFHNIYEDAINNKKLVKE